MATLGERELIHHGRKFDFERVHFTNDRGQHVALEVVRHPGAVCILPLLMGSDTHAAGRILMIRNFRPAIGRTLWELPAGTIEQGESPDACAGREVEEEVGFRAGHLEFLGSFHTTPGMTDELMHAWLATDLEQVGQRLEQDESITVEPVTVNRAFQMIDSGELMDGKSIVTLILAQRKGFLEVR